MRLQRAPAVAYIAESVTLLDVTADIELCEATLEFGKEAFQPRDAGGDNG